MIDDSSAAGRRTLFQQAVDGVLSRPRMLWALAVIAMVLDVVITGIGLSIGLSERNPVVNAAIDSIGLFWAGVVVKGAALGLGYACWRFLPRLVPETARHRNLFPLGLALPSWIAVGINTGLVLSVV